MENNKILKILLALLSIVLIVVVLVIFLKNKNSSEIVKQNQRLENQVSKLSVNNERLKKLVPTTDNSNKDLINSSDIFINKMFNTQNESNYKDVKQAINGISTTRFMEKNFKNEHPQYNRPLNTKIYEAKHFIEEANNDIDKKEVVITFKRNIYNIDEDKKQGQILTKELMTVKCFFERNNNKWLISEYDVLGDKEYVDK